MLPDDRPAAPAPDAGPRRREVLNAEDYHERKLEEAEEARKARVLPMRRPVKQTSPCPRCGEWDHLACIDLGPDGAPVNVGWIPDAPRPEDAVDQHREGECDCCDEWRRALQAERALASAREAALREGAEAMRECIVYRIWGHEWRDPDDLVRQIRALPLPEVK